MVDWKSDCRPVHHSILNKECLADCLTGRGEGGVLKKKTYNFEGVILGV